MSRSTRSSIRTTSSSPTASGPSTGSQHRALLGVLLDVERLLQLQRRAFVGRHLGHVLEVLPVDAAPGDALVDLLHRDLAHAGLDLVPDETLLVEAGAGLDLLRLDRPAPARRHLDQRVGGQQVLAAQQQGVDRVGRGLGGLPVLRLLLLEQPHPAVLDRLRRRSSPRRTPRSSAPGSRSARGTTTSDSSVSRQNMPISSLLTRAFLDRFHDGLRRVLVAEALQGHGQVALRLAVGQREPVLGAWPRK